MRKLSQESTRYKNS